MTIKTLTNFSQRLVKVGVQNYIKIILTFILYLGTLK